MEEENKKYWTDDDELVMKYVLGQITPEEKKRMDEEIAESEQCKAKLRKEMEIATGIRRHGRDLMKAQLRTKLRRARATQFSEYHYVGLAAAVLVVAVGIGAYQIWFSDLVAPKQFQQQEIVLQPRHKVIEEENHTEEFSEPLTDKQSDETLQKPSASTDKQKILADATNDRPSVEPDLPSRETNHSVVPKAESAVDQSTAGTAQSEAIWLIGKVVMISDRSSEPSIAAMPKERTMKRAESLTKENMAELSVQQTVSVKRRVKDEGIILQQRAIKDLPAGFAQRKDAREHTVQTLLERSDTGISLTLYGDAVNDEELQEAVVETLTDDSLVVSLAYQRIAFRMPAGWNVQPARR